MSYKLDDIDISSYDAFPYVVRQKIVLPYQEYLTFLSVKEQRNIIGEPVLNRLLMLKILNWMAGLYFYLWWFALKM
jgi:hypothetical protein